MDQSTLSPSYRADENKTSKGFAVLLATTIFLSAFLLFQVQPLISKYILPWFGGSPAVWTTAMLFFQSLLFIGYSYSHGICRYLPIRGQACLHIGLLLASTFAAVFVLPGQWLRPTGKEDPAMRILLLLLLTVGLPYFTLATTGPLIQSWFSRAFPGQSPYRLYSLSNLGSFLALLTFPYAFEPFFELPKLGWFWTVGFWCFSITAIGVAIHLFRLNPPALIESEDDSDGAPPTILDRFAWVGLPALASLSFISTTDHVSHDVAPEPRLWITTLSLYLLTFIICFDHERWYRRGFIAAACLVGILFLSGRDQILSWLGLEFDLSMTASRWTHFLVMFLICWMCHGELVRRRPKSHHFLTEFYLWMSLGGACGGLFVTLIATNYFHDYYEWSAMLLISLSIGTMILVREIKVRLGDRHGLTKALQIIGTTVCLIVGAFIAYCEDPFSWRPYDYDDFDIKTISQSRNFYGAIGTVGWDHKTNPRESFRVFFSGMIKHGTQYTDPSRRSEPTSYYSRESGLGETFEYAQSVYPSMRIAVVGLGVGTVATYARPTDEMDFFEINPQVIPVAQEQFWYLKDCKAAKSEIILGDARLKLEALPDDVQYDLIVLDAFSGDSVPVHLLTVEAFAIYKKHLKPRGFIAINITNSYLNLYPVAKRQAENLGMTFRSKYVVSNPDKLQQRSHYFVMTHDQEYVRKYPSVYRSQFDKDGKEIGTIDPNLPNIPLWTDHFSSINAIQLDN